MAARRIGFLLGQPTQFDAPFFRHAQAAGGAELSVLFAKADARSSVHDPELGRRVDWGFDLRAGYPNQVLPEQGRLQWLRRELQPARYDWLVINGYTTLPYLETLAIARARGIRTGLRIDSVLFNADGWLRQGRKRAVMAVLARAFDRFFATGSLAREYLVHFGIAPDRITLFPYGVDVESFAAAMKSRDALRADLRGRLGIPPAAKVILAVAKMNDRETPWDLVAALEKSRRADVRTVLAGDGPQLAALRARVAASAIPGIEFAGYVPYADLAGYYAMADVFVHAAADEPWGVSVHEAIACGVPVVASSRVGAARDLVLAGRNGYTYRCGDVAELGARLAAALDDLDPRVVNTACAEVLSRWNYAVTWRGIIEACA